jgi:hypothetical protein
LLKDDESDLEISKKNPILQKMHNYAIISL